MKPVIINIKSLIENFIIEDATNSSENIQEKIIEALLKAINDVNLSGAEKKEPNNSKASPLEQAFHKANYSKESKIKGFNSVNELDPKYSITDDTNDTEMVIKVKDLNQLFTELKRLRHHEATTIGLWAIDRKPTKVSYKWIKKEAFRIKKLDTCL